MKVNKLLARFLLLICLSFYIGDLGAQQIDYSTKKITLVSEILGEQRNIELWYPKDSLTNVVALYVLDGNWNNELVKGTIGHWVRWGLCPNVLVVSIDNIGKRTTDLTPTVDDARFPGSGGASNFLRFISQELKPKIASYFPETDGHVLFGHSFGGLFTLYTLKEQPSLFDAYIAVSPSVWWKDRFMYESYQYDSKQKPFVYISAGTNDRGNEMAAKEYVSWLLQNELNERIELHHEIFEGENHFSNVPITLHHSLNELFPRRKWASRALETLDEFNVNALSDSITIWKQQYSFRFLLPEDELLEKAANLFKNDAFDASVGLLKLLIREAPGSYRPAYYLGNFYEGRDQAVSIDYYEKALETGAMPERMRIVIERRIKKLKSS